MVSDYVANQALCMLRTLRFFVAIEGVLVTKADIQVKIVSGRLELQSVKDSVLHLTAGRAQSIMIWSGLYMQTL
jgi:hypothetical protein